MTNNEKENKNNVCLNNVVYDLSKITNPHLKQALQERGDPKFMHGIFRRGSHKDEIVHVYRSLSPDYEYHVDEPYHCETHHVEAYNEYKDGNNYTDYS